MKKYSDKNANLHYPKHKVLNIFLKEALQKSLIYEKALKEAKRN